MNQKADKIVLVEGVDGAGKSTYVSRVESECTDFCDIQVVSFPSPALRERLRVGDSVNRGEFLIDFEDVLDEVDKSVDMIVCDRSFISTAVYQLSSPFTMYETIELGLEIFSQHADRIEIYHIKEDYDKICDRLISRVSLSNIESSETMDGMEQFVLYCISELGLLRGRLEIKDVLGIMDKLYMAAIETTLELCSRYGIACSYETVKL